MLSQILSGNTLRRYATRLLLLALALTFVVRAQKTGIPGTVALSFDNSTTAQNSIAWIFGVAWWWTAEFIPFSDPYFVYEANTCPNGNAVVNHARNARRRGDVVYLRCS